MLWLLAVVVGFLLVSFVVTAAADFTAWRISISAKSWEEESQAYEAVRKSMLENRSLTDQDHAELLDIERRIGAMWRYADHSHRHQLIERFLGTVSWARAFVEFVAPVIAGGTALALLMKARCEDAPN